MFRFWRLAYVHSGITHGAGYDEEGRPVLVMLYFFSSL